MISIPWYYPLYPGLVESPMPVADPNLPTLTQADCVRSAANDLKPPSMNIQRNVLAMQEAHKRSVMHEQQLGLGHWPYFQGS